MAESYFPLRWESTGDQWWYASPIDWAAANGHYELVRELLHLDTNLLIKLTSLRRIRRLETVWDDDAQFIDAAKCRSFVARNLLHECETKNNKNSLIRAGYGGWLLYTAASAGDIGFVHELLERDPLLVFGEGEYGVTDILYAAARGKSTEVFRLIFTNAVSPRGLVDGAGEADGGGSRRGSGNVSVFRWEIVNRAVLAAARGGNLEMLKELIGECSDVLAYRDSQGSTILHAASGRGQVEVVNDLIAAYNIIESRDNQGNTSLHVAAFRGHLPIVEALLSASPSLSYFKNNSGDTFLHMAIAGFRTPGFRRLDRQMELMKHLIYGNIINIQAIINIQNNDGRTALHVAVIGNLQCNLVEVLMTIPSIKLNIQDIDGMTPLDLLCRRPHSASSDILVKLLVSAGGISHLKDLKAKAAIVTQVKMQSGIGNSPGTSFRISDGEIFLYTGIEASEASGRPSSSSSIGKNELQLPHFEPIEENNEHSDKKKASSSVNSAARRLKILLRWPRRKEKKTDDDSMTLLKKWSEREETPTPLRQRFLKPQSSLINNKRTLAVRTSMPSPTTKKKFAAGLMHGVIQAMPHLAPSQTRMPLSSLSSSLLSSPTLEKQKGVYEDDEATGDTACSNYTGSSSHRSSFKNAKLMNQYFCFGAQGLALDGSSTNQRQSRLFRGCVPPVS
ncbi:kinase D-interacting substrate of 220 kDa [Dendrobium catenatum]|uniref:Ankyrin repeat-containing protein n=1 Tax=Dendrobium catenatum TaxID=906689 RepID=A0A2I0X148_9ASPA|nr:kinase D-interacting substrate of 220 kDa [Dendrobium catenatum]PKU81636.1 Ankyrin repeat-containing protein [Dendrobium catenatum]